MCHNSFYLFILEPNLLISPYNPRLKEFVPLIRCGAVNARKFLVLWRKTIKPCGAYFAGWLSAIKTKLRKRVYFFYYCKRARLCVFYRILSDTFTIETVLLTGCKFSNPSNLKILYKITLHLNLKYFCNFIETFFLPEKLCNRVKVTFMLMLKLS